MFEISDPAIPSNLTSLMVLGGMIGIGILIVVASILYSWKKTKTAILAVFLIVLLGITSWYGIYLRLNPNIQVVDNPIGHDGIHMNVRANNEKIEENIADELDVTNVRLAEQGAFGHLHEPLMNGEAVSFSAIKDTESISGTIHFTEESMVITVFENAGEAVIVSTE